MSSRRPPTQDNSSRNLLEAILGAGGLALLSKLGLSFIPDAVPQKQILDDLVPWFSGATGAFIAWAWGALHRRSAKNDALEALLETEELLTKLTMDPNVGSEDRQRVREMLSNLKVYRAVATPEEARAYGEALAEEVKQLLASRLP